MTTTTPAWLRRMSYRRPTALRNLARPKRAPQEPPTPPKPDEPMELTLDATPPRPGSAKAIDALLAQSGEFPGDEADEMECNAIVEALLRVGQNDSRDEMLAIVRRMKRLTPEQLKETNRRLTLAMKHGVKPSSFSLPVKRYAAPGAPYRPPSDLHLQRIAMSMSGSSPTVQVHAPPVNVNIDAGRIAEAVLAALPERLTIQVQTPPADEMDILIERDSVGRAVRYLKRKPARRSPTP